VKRNKNNYINEYISLLMEVNGAPSDLLTLRLYTGGLYLTNHVTYEGN